MASQGYSNAFEFLDDDEQPEQPARPQRLRQPPPAALPPPLPPLSPLQQQLPAPAAPPLSGEPGQGSGPRPVLYIKSDRLAQLSGGLPVNADRSTLVHSLVEAFGLLEVGMKAACRVQLGPTVQCCPAAPAAAGNAQIQACAPFLHALHHARRYCPLHSSKPRLSHASPTHSAARGPPALACRARWCRNRRPSRQQRCRRTTLLITWLP